MDIDFKEKAWIVLPGQQGVFCEFTTIAKDYLLKNPLYHKTPILVIGDSGVGKSLFLEAATQIALSYGASRKSIVRLNCASFTSQIAESEIFGHIKGAFTGATRDKEGIVKVADGGLLILDEIGELSEEVQAKLLIFIEEGKYRRVGSNKLESANLKIIGTTNKPQKSFRPDFWFRFFPIFIPPVHERRLDVLYFIAHKYPDIFCRLTPQHALTLLSYNWPGNVREIERVISLIMLEDSLVSGGLGNREAGKGMDSNPLCLPSDKRQTLLSFSSLCDFNVKLAGNGFGVNSLNKILLKYGLSLPFSLSFSGGLYDFYRQIKMLVNDNLDTLIGECLNKLDNVNDSELNYEQTAQGKTYEFVMLKQANFLANYEQFQGYKCDYYRSIDVWRDSSCVKQLFEKIFLINTVSKIEKVGICFDSLCRLFLKNPRADKDIFSSHEHSIADTCWTNNLERKIFEKFYKKNLVKQALEFVAGVKIATKYECVFSESWEMHVKQMLTDDEFSMVMGDENVHRMDFELFALNEDDLLREYYKYLIDKYKTKLKAAEHAGVNYSTFRSKLDSLGFSRRKYERGNK